MAKPSAPPRANQLYLYVNERQRKAVQSCAPGILLHIKKAVESAGWQCGLRSVADSAKSGDSEKNTFHILLNKEIIGPSSLNLRRCYFAPFWRIEDSNDRWNFQVASRIFDPSEIPLADAETFRDRWQHSFWGNREITREGFIFMPLQGKLTTRRHFQSLSPLEMIEATLSHDTARHIQATLHPDEVYSDEELAWLKKMELQNQRFILSETPSVDLLLRCDYTVTENSGMSLIGYFAHKPAVLFAEIDFHHAAGSVPRVGIEAAFAHARSDIPFSRYLFWFFRKNALNGGANDIEVQILSRLREHGWPI